jgi:xanthine dehydrogenase accessory factor
VLVRGIGDIGSAVAHRLFQEGYVVVIHDVPKPATTRRGMAFADAAFEGRTALEGVEAIRALDFERINDLLASRTAIPVYVRPLGPLLKMVEPDILIDARMRKHTGPEVQKDLAPFVVGLGPSLEAGRHADVVVETSWDGLGHVITSGASRPLAGEPRVVGGHARDRYVYAPFDGVFRTKAHIGDIVRRGQEIAEIEFTVLSAPLDGVIRGLTRDGVRVTVRTKVIEIDPRGSAAEVWGIGERPRQIADGVLAAIHQWEHARGM